MSDAANIPADPPVHDDDIPTLSTKLIGPAERISAESGITRVAALQPSLPGYEILAVLGQGGMGVAYKAWQRELKRTVALKMLRFANAGPDDILRFQKEAEAARRLRHPNIVQIHEVGELDGRPFLCLEYVDGGNLDRQLAGHPLRARHAATLLATLARAVHFAHEQGIVHRDLKPGNVLLQAAGDRGQESGVRRQGSGVRGQAAADSCVLSPDSWIPKITDFGLAKFLIGERSRQTRRGAVLGTPSYMAPEQADGRNEDVGPPADIYALGAILYELLTGRPPFRGESPLETVRLVQVQKPVPISSLRLNVPRDLEAICLKCLEKDPVHRYPSAAALANDLTRFLEGKPIDARPPGFFARLGSWCRRHRMLLLALGIAACAIAAGLYYWL